jgi:hypothetical protein
MTCDWSFEISSQALSMNTALEVKSGTDSSLRASPGTAVMHQALRNLALAGSHPHVSGLAACVLRLL